jgi:hypothetical protein
MIVENSPQHNNNNLLNMNTDDDRDLEVSKAIENGTWNPPSVGEFKPMSEALKELLNEVDPFSMTEAEFNALLEKKEKKYQD